ncbi:MAG: trypsin-like peptidase domain-containing protein [Oscillospiraceae bacterium]|nr:trypsin-like peptidase domain-containing protein [Oscillospiraceae bacterium]
MNSNWYHSQNWYAPLVSEEVAAPAAPEKQESIPEDGQKKKKRRKGMTPGRIAGLIILLLLVIAGSSLAFRQNSADLPITLPGLPEEKTEMPDSMEDFFKQYYEAVESDSVEVNVPRTEERPDFTLTLQPALEEELTLQELYEQCAPAIVSISGYEGDNVGYNWGSGVVIGENGLILTNTHVLEDCDRAVVTLDDGREFEAELIGADAISDIALLKIDAKGLKTAPLGESANLRVGDRVAAIGNPLGEDFRNTLTDGIISAIERGMTYHGRSMTLLQTNTAINEGNSGGALFNLYGQVIGITNMKMMSSYSSIEGIGFAIPSVTACNVVNALLKDGEVKGRPAIGITVGSIPQNAKDKYELPDGLYVSEVSEGSDAKEKGVQAGDIILAVNGTEVRTTEDILNIKNELQVGDTMTLSIWRDGETMDITIALVDTNDIYS